MTTWNDYFNAQAPHLDFKSGNRVKLGHDQYGEGKLIIFKGDDCIEMVKEEAEQLRDFLNETLPGAPTAGGASIVNCEARGCYVAPKTLSRETAEAMEKALDEAEKKEPVYTAPEPVTPPPPLSVSKPEPGDEEVTEAEAIQRATTGIHEKLVADIMALIKRFISEDSGHWSYTDPVFINHHTSQSEVLLGNVKSVVTLEAIQKDLDAVWAKRHAPPPEKKSKKSK